MGSTLEGHLHTRMCQTLEEAVVRRSSSILFAGTHFCMSTTTCTVVDASDSYRREQSRLLWGTTSPPSGSFLPLSSFSRSAFLCEFHLKLRRTGPLLRWETSIVTTVPLICSWYPHSELEGTIVGDNDNDIQGMLRLCPRFDGRDKAGFREYQDKFRG